MMTVSTMRLRLRRTARRRCARRVERRPDKRRRSARRGARACRADEHTAPHRAWREPHAQLRRSKRWSGRRKCAVSASPHAKKGTC
jgi:hypothetical protein